MESKIHLQQKHLFKQTKQESIHAQGDVNESQVNPKNRERQARTELTTSHMIHQQWTTPETFGYKYTG